MAASIQSPIAVVGVAYRAPGTGRKGLYDFLAEAKSAFSPIPKDRFEQEAYCYNDSEKAGVFAPKGAHFLPYDIYAFDAPFFNMNGEEVTSMDPQHRMILECALEAVENAGIPLNELAGSNTGVFAAMERCEYGERLMDDLPTLTKYSAPGTSGCMASNRLSYFFDLKGPSVSLDSACSSSAYAVHLACQSLRMTDCNTAFVGASSLIVNANALVLLDTMGALSPDGKCYSYDSRGNGFGRGEGGACLILKRLDDAIAAGDSIHAVIRNTVGNHSGRTRGITMPSQQAQEDVLLRVHTEVDLEPSDTTFVEGHGTGTQVGDPIDAGAVANVVAKDRADPVYIGSLKSNFGHLLSASGMLAIVKAILMIRHATILPNSGFEEMHPKIDASKLKVAQTPVPWPSKAHRRVCVTNFGFGGSNAAVLLEEFQGDASRARGLCNGHGSLNGHGTPNGQGNANGHSPQLGQTNGTYTNGHSQSHASRRLLAFSAKSEKSLSLFLSSFASYLKNMAPLAATDTFMADLSFTLGQRRTHFLHRLALAADSVEDLIQQLSSLPPSSTGKVRSEKEPVPAFVFTGQGAQHARMAAELHQYEPFAAALLDAEDCLQQFGATWSLAEDLRKSEAEGSRVNDAEISQPACTAVQLGLVMLLRSWGMSPTVVAGHSSGEIAAAYTAGFLSFKTAMAIAFFRGRSTVELHEKSDSIRGGMIALGIDIDTATTLLESTAGVGRAGIVAINSPNSVTVSGDMSAIDAIEQIANAQGLFNRKLKVGVAYHSHHMELVAASYQAAIEPYCDADRTSTNLNNNKTPDQVVFFSSVTGRRERADTLTSASYWVKNLVSPVRFLEAVQGVVSTADSGSKVANVIVEVGPHAALKGPINQTLQSMSETQAIYLPTLVRGTDATKTVLGLVGRMFIMGSSLDFAAVNKTNANSACVLTDLPPYEWNKNASYLHKSPISVQKMHPGHTYTPLLGWKMPSEGNEHTFRQVFTLDEMPWIRDHKVVGDVLFPFSGFVSLAVDAFRTVTGATSELSSVLIRELHVKRGLKVDENQRVDISTKLRPAETGTGTFSSTVWAFEVMTWAESTRWATHVYGRIEAGTADMATAGSPARTTAEKLLSMAKPTAENAEEEYKVFQKSGVSFGPTFKNMVGLWTAPSTAVHETVLRQIDEALSLPSRGSHITVDPPTLDTLFHSAIIVAGKNHQDPRPVFVPVYISRYQISNMIPATAGQKFTTVTHRLGLDEKSGRLHLEFVIFASAPSGPVPCLEVDMTMQRITQPDNDIEQSMEGLPNGYYESLVPHVGLVDGNTLAEALADYDLDHSQLLMRRQFAAVGRHFLAHALKVTANDDRSNMPSHFSKFLRWAKGRVAEFDDLQVTSQLIDEVSRGSATGELLCAVGKQIPRILRGQVELLEIMMKDGLLTRHYEDDMATHRGNQALSKYVAGLGELNPKLRILEVGAGTGSATLPILEALSGGDSDKNDISPKFSHYTFTDISSGFFEGARKKLARWPQLTYNKLDIGRDPAEQGFDVGTYDLVIATNVLHATPDIQETVRNIRTLLKPGTGKLGILEVVHNDDPVALPFTLLPGWWLVSDDFRGSENGPLMSQDNWHRLFTSNGFSGVEGAIEDWPGAAEHSMSAYWTTRIDEDDDFGLDDGLSDTPKSVTICGPMATPEEMKLAEAVSEAVEQSLGIPAPQIQSLSEFDGVQDSFCIFLDSGKSSFLTTLASEHDFDMLKSILLESNGLLWVTPKNDSPEYSRIKGILRTLRLEDASKKFLQVDTIPDDPVQGAAVVAQLARSLVRDRAPTAFREQEFVWRNGMIHVPRLRRLRETEETFAIEAGVSIRKEQNIWESHGPESAIRMSIDTPGSIDSIYFERHSLTRTSLGDDEIIVKVDAVGVNFRDLLLLLGTIPWSLPGVEGAGTVVQAGSNVSHVQTGDRVLYMVQEGGFSTYVRMSGLRACKLPQSISAADAASLPTAYSTALMCLDRVARVRRGESVLIHAASGAVGQACIRLAQNIGAVVFATAGSVEKREFLHKTFAIPEDRIYSSRTPEFRQGILNKTDGKGVDVVVNSLSGQLLQETWSLIAEFGRFIEIGKKDVLDNSHLGMRNFYRNVTFTCVDLDQYFVKRPEFLKECLIEIVDMLERKVIGPIQPVTKLPVSEVVSGFRKLQSGNNIGKIVTILGPGEKVMAESPSPLQQQGKLLHTNATYVITGGTGGIGRSLVAWMLDNGAANVILLGRSGASNPDVAKIIQQNNQPASGIHVRAIACDVASRAGLGAALDAIKDLPPVRGVIHGSLYLRDSMFMNATFEDWQKIKGPKIDAAWHLHELLPKLDFFVALASGTGVVGNIGQSIYSGTSTFLDAFVQYRTRQRLPSVSISLPIVDDVGYVIEREGMRAQLGNNIGIKLSIAQVHAIIKGAIIGASSGLNYDSRTVAFVREDSAVSEGWEDRSHYLSAVRRKKASEIDGAGQHGGSDAPAGEEGVLEALSSKVSSITMIDREDVTPGRSLLEYGLDSLVAVELRNWIKRECGVELALMHIVGAANLQALADQIISQQK
ncbi:hypothetical protein MMC30_008528 [Trapelia coarctata]|nr:hypothetical protein [Trapelia coarctata]